MMLIAAVIYLLVFLLFIYKIRFFGLFKDEQLSPRQFTAFFFLKSLAIPVFCLVYDKMYGGIEKFDAGIFYSDARALNQLAWLDLSEYFKALFGLQNDAPGSYFYDHCLIYTQNWDNGKLKDFFYNDNRLVIRLHSILHFIAFDSYFVHALFNCFLSFTGIFFLYKSFKNFFKCKEILFFMVLCFFPALWFYTGAVLKEGITLFVLGSTVYLIKKTTHGGIGAMGLTSLAFLLFVSALLKPYVLCLGLACFGTFFLIYRSQKIPYKVMCFVFVIALAFVGANFLFLHLNGQSALDMALGQQRIFSNASKGGIFLQDESKLLRLDYDTSLILQTPGTDNYTIKKNSTYIYWEHHHQYDTLFCSANADTVKQYRLVYQADEGGSNIPIHLYSKSPLSFLSTSMYYGLFFPLFFNARGMLQLLASFENVLIILSFLIIIKGLVENKHKHFVPFTLLFFALSLCLIVGMTTPNSGAIFRYRSPAVPFLLLSALYYLEPFKMNFFKRKN
ncbi:MAG: hypothetical protein V4635_08670 [Bacteroidota bacterium]